MNCDRAYNLWMADTVLLLQWSVSTTPARAGPAVELSVKLSYLRVSFTNDVFLKVFYKQSKYSKIIDQVLRLWVLYLLRYSFPRVWLAFGTTQVLVLGAHMIFDILMLSQKRCGDNARYASIDVCGPFLFELWTRKRAVSVSFVSNANISALLLAIVNKPGSFVTPWCCG